jgi:hypothetical protein
MENEKLEFDKPAIFKQIRGQSIPNGLAILSEMFTAHIAIHAIKPGATLC